ncbi:exonuclease domain-containing protein [Arthrobacter caoxuetaonis]|uniref:DNA polymerase III n=1 Tax=Arthrobacter caoxuetaonis TaxID=2886935 RepID=A0A9X1SGL3_9MICC|nr:exonuclease domain-containing protein [Arthrobacter caoxuetaonis]MCC3299489.1 DNA polymerase III [Arthrobacter caoxuetaonis]USQ59019.1 exonuclease domain-containing protein [Arthrobacter caoxuetaonis]
MDTIPGLNFTTVDFEAANSDRLSVISVGFASVRDGLVRSTGTWLIRPERGADAFDPYAQRIHGITPAMAAAGDSLKDSMERLSRIFGADPVIAHNMKYERAVLTSAVRELKLPALTNELRCSEVLARTALRLPKTRLHLVAEALGLPEFEKHDSGADALACAEVVLAIARREGAKTVRGLYKGLGIA